MIGIQCDFKMLVYLFVGAENIIIPESHVPPVRNQICSKVVHSKWYTKHVLRERERDQTNALRYLNQKYEMLLPFPKQNCSR